MTFEEAIRKAIKAYFDGLGPDQFTQAHGKKQKYNKKYFDRVGKANGIEPLGKDVIGIKTKAKS